jgi:Domain of unknown function (DUF1772)
VTSITFSFILVGIITTISPLSKNTSNRYKKRHHPVFHDSPSFAVDFPKPSSPEHSARTRLLGRQWPHYWTVGNRFFRPTSTLEALGYGFMTWVAYRGGPHAKGDWRLYAVATAMHVITIVHSAVNMQPINNQHRFHLHR